MMDTTPLGFPYPECDPPRVKDLSDIGQLRALAEAVDTTVQQVADDLDAQLITPLAARMRQSVATAWPAGTATPILDQVIFASPGMGDTTAGGIRITSRGWYMIGTYTLVIIGSGTELQARPILFRNQSLLVPHGDRAQLVTATAEDPYLSTTALLEVGDLITVRIGTTGAAGFSTTAHLWAIQLLAA